MSGEQASERARGDEREKIQQAIKALHGRQNISVAEYMQTKRVIESMIEDYNRRYAGGQKPIKRRTVEFNPSFFATFTVGEDRKAKITIGLIVETVSGALEFSEVVAKP